MTTSTYLENNESGARFLDEASHELRTPITALKGQMQLMQRRLRKDPTRQDDLEDLDKMLYQVERINHQLDIFVSTSHIAEKCYTLLIAPCDLIAVARRLVAIYAAGVSAHTVRFESSVETLIGNWDQRRLEEAIEALLSNAVKYSQHGEVLVSVSRSGNTAHLEVRDEGIGVPSRERSAIFRAYTTGSTVENAGVGLGLYVAREAIKRQHGNIGVQSRTDKEGTGSVFWIELPLAPPEKRPTARQPRKNQEGALAVAAVS